MPKGLLSEQAALLELLEDLTPAGSVQLHPSDVVEAPLPDPDGPRGRLGLGVVKHPRDALLSGREAAEVLSGFEIGGGTEGIRVRKQLERRRCRLMGHAVGLSKCDATGKREKKGLQRGFEVVSSVTRVVSGTVGGDSVRKTDGARKGSDVKI